ncbi:hypothetical protein AAFC00_002361 [Neodothiora populina]|uniref:endo-polygalacturonase n=1 Tax=Neodothiora populina TaxID=2781224 RepID=A0ABR3PH68_9PEZI
MPSISSVALALLASGVSTLALPAAPAVTPKPRLNLRASTSSSGGACTFSDAAAVSASQASCATIVLDNVAVPSGATLDLTNLNDDTTVIFQGTTTFGYDEWEGPLVSVAGTGIKVQGADGAILDGDGSRWWDGKGGNGGKTKPKFFEAHKLISSSISDITIKNSPVQIFSINGAQGLTVSNVTVDNKDGDKTNSDGDALGHNTDAFDVGSSTDVTISGCTVYNQDDCLAINSGSGITFTGGYCSGGHGLSIGSVGGRSDNTVENIVIENSQIVNSMNGVRIKTVSGETGTVKNITYSEIKLSGITDYGIVIEQDYENGSPTGTPTDGIPVTEVTVSGVTGTVADDASPIYILCASCSDWTWEGVSITGGKKSDKCEGIPTGASC